MRNISYPVRVSRLIPIQKMFTTDTPPALSGTLPDFGEGTLREAAPRLWGGVLSMCPIVFSNWYYYSLLTTHDLVFLIPPADAAIGCFLFASPLSIPHGRIHHLSWGNLFHRDKSFHDCFDDGSSNSTPEGIFTLGFIN